MEENPVGDQNFRSQWGVTLPVDTQPWNLGSLPTDEHATTSKPPWALQNPGARALGIVFSFQHVA